MVKRRGTRSRDERMRRNNRSNRQNRRVTDNICRRGRAIHPPHDEISTLESDLASKNRARAASTTTFTTGTDPITIIDSNKSTKNNSKQEKMNMQTEIEILSKECVD